MGTRDSGMGNGTTFYMSLFLVTPKANLLRRFSRLNLAFFSSSKPVISHFITISVITIAGLYPSRPHPLLFLTFSTYHRAADADVCRKCLEIVKSQLSTPRQVSAQTMTQHFISVHVVSQNLDPRQERGDN